MSGQRRLGLLGQLTNRGENRRGSGHERQPALGQPAQLLDLRRLPVAGGRGPELSVNPHLE
jgi:hypothetical protein